MNRLLLFCCCAILFTACKKVSDPAVINNDQRTIDENIINQYITENKLTVVNPGDSSGVRAIVVKQGPISTLYSLSSSVTVGYTGKQLTSGKIFAQTDSIHPSFKLGEALSGWKIGILKGQVNKGGIIRLIIPSRHGYGPYAQPGLGLPANAILDFTIEIFDVTN
ncbi:FKBP-type peptidyl-prolyl cis-trans isomerase [Mucilaginibacter sp. CSA2-8R]|uniref:FKBP-type peptidyl-prolyl cis-trans isomerase n=1 Tax=Mucilaginibacter sp. CSA2-8R TaxID=3141542 RepID=UPI00315CB8AF